MKINKNKILAIMQLPPPVHGQSMMNQIIYDSKLITESFDFKTISLHFAELGDIGKPSIKKLWKMIYYLFAIFKDLIVFKPDLIYFTLAPTNFAFYRDAIYVILIKFFRVPIVFHLHGKGINEKARNPFVKIIYSFVFKNSKIILLSALLKTDVENVVRDLKSLSYLPNGIKTELSSTIQKTPIENAYPVVLYLSNMAKTKGVLVLLEAAKILVKKGKKFKINLVGAIHQSLPKRELVRAISDPIIRENVNYLGPKYGKEKYDVLNTAHIFVFPTYREAFPLVILEAMQSGLPVLSTYEGAIPEIVDDGDTGYLVQQKDARELANKLEKLLKDESLRREMGRRGKEKFSTNYTIDVFEQKLKKILDDILHEIKK